MLCQGMHSLAGEKNAETLEVAGLSRSFPAANTEGTMAPGPTSSWRSQHICEEGEAGPGVPSQATLWREGERPDLTEWTHKGQNIWGLRGPSLHLSSQYLEEQKLFVRWKQGWKHGWEHWRDPDMQIGKHSVTGMWGPAWGVRGLSAKCPAM